MNPITNAADKAREWTERRDTLIRQAAAEGATLRHIGQAAGLSHTAIAKILKRGRAEPAAAIS